MQRAFVYLIIGACFTVTGSQAGVVETFRLIKSILDNNEQSNALYGEAYDRYDGPQSRDEEPTFDDPFGLNPFAPEGLKTFLEEQEPTEKLKLKKEYGLVYDHIPKESMKVFNDSLIERQGFPPISGDPIPRYVDWLFGVVILIFVLTAGALTSPLYFLPEALDDNWNNLIENIIDNVPIIGRTLTDDEGRALNTLGHAEKKTWMGRLTSRLLEREQCSRRFDCETMEFFRNLGPTSNLWLIGLRFLGPPRIKAWASRTYERLEKEPRNTSCLGARCTWLRWSKEAINAFFPGYFART